MELPASYAKAPLKIAMLAGEPSGDKLGCSLIKAVKQKWPDAVLVGIGGPDMIDEGFHSLYPMERLSVMGFFEPLKRARELLQLRSTIKKLLIQNPPDIFIGIDAPDFNLSLEKALKRKGIFTMHYVSPTIWAWRPGRIHTIKKAVEHMMLIFPFEKAIYDRHQCPATFVGHTLASQYPIEKPSSQARDAIGIAQDVPCLALLIGSRESEVKRFSDVFLKTAALIKEKEPRLSIVVAMLNQRLARQFEASLANHPNLKVRVVVGRTQQVLQAADIAMVKSGTSTLEATLAKVPHIVVYKTSWLTFQLAKRLIKTPFISMTNIMAGKEIVKEYIQEQCNPVRMAEQLALLLKPSESKRMQQSFTHIHKSLKQDTNKVAVELIASNLTKIR